MRQDIAAAASRMTNKLGTKRELKNLLSQLWEGETVHHITSGFYSSGNGILVATDKRLLFYFKGVVRSTSEDFPYSKISSIEVKSGIMFATLTIYASNQRAEITQIAKAEAEAFASFARMQTA